MPRPRLTPEVAEITAADRHSPGRFKGRSNPKVKSLGPPPNRLSDDQKKIRAEFKEDFPWLGRSDRALVEVATNLLNRVRQLGPETPIALYAQMRMILGQMGGTPVDRSKVFAPDDKPYDPAGEFLN